MLVQVCMYSNTCTSTVHLIECVCILGVSIFELKARLNINFWVCIHTGCTTRVASEPPIGISVAPIVGWLYFCMHCVLHFEISS